MSYIAILKVNSDTNRVEKFQSFSTQEEAEAHVQKFIGTYPLAYCVAEPNGSSDHWLCDTSSQTIEISELVDPDVYKKKRKAEYPSIADQLDYIYHNGIDGWKATIKVTKDKYPKP